MDSAWWWVIGAAIVVLPFVLTRLFSGSSGDTTRVLGAEQRAKPAGVTRGQRPGAGAKPAKAAGAPAQPADGLQSISSALRLSREIGPKLIELIKSGQKIEAIKLIREKTGVDLKTAKSIVDRLSP